jgi:hypothetical protein
MTRLSRCVAIGVLLLGLSTTSVEAQQPPPATASTGTLTGMTCDVMPDGKVVVTLVATGDLTGLLTLQFTPGASGGYDGEWAISVQHADHTDPATGAEPVQQPHDDTGNPDDHPHQDFTRLVQRGSLSGSISGALVTFNADGALTGFTAPLTISKGFKEFAGVTGSGEATLTTFTFTF